MPSPPGLSGSLWPMHPKPFSDELLSSWIVRIARAHGSKPTLFWKRQVPSIHFRTVDRQPDEVLLKLISAKTGTPLDRVEAAAVGTYGSLGLCRNGSNDDVIGFCPACLGEGVPYFRRRWRLEFYFACEIHGSLLYDSCPVCRGLVRLERIPLDANSLAICHACRFDLTKAELKQIASTRIGNLLGLQRRFGCVLDTPARSVSMVHSPRPNCQIRVTNGNSHLRCNIDKERNGDGTRVSRHL
jgi:hypothetical protein